MSMDPGTMQQLLMQKLQQPAQAGTAGGGQGGPQMQGQVSPMNAAATLAQKAMLVRALQGQQQAQQQPIAQGMLPGTQAQMAADPQMQALQAQGLQGAQLPQPPLPAAQ